MGEEKKVPGEGPQPGDGQQRKEIKKPEESAPGAMNAPAESQGQPAENAEDIPDVELYTKESVLQQYDDNGTITSRGTFSANPKTTHEARVLHGGDLLWVRMAADKITGRVFFLFAHGEGNGARRLTYHDSGHTFSVAIGGLLSGIDFKVPAGRKAEVPVQVKVVRVRINGELFVGPGMVIEVKKRELKVSKKPAPKDPNAPTTKGKQKGKQTQANKQANAGEQPKDTPPDNGQTPPKS